MEMIPVAERLPREEKRYLCQVSFAKVDIFYVFGFSNNLYEVDKFDFSDKKNVKGFYDYDSEWGYTHMDDVVAWCELPKPIKVN